MMGGYDVTALPPERRPAAMVFQSYALFPHLTVEGNVAFGLKIRRKSGAEIRRKVNEILELVQLSGLNKRKMDELSGGQQQRVALARVLAIEPSILLMDEPLSNLDAALRRSTRSTIRRIQTELGLTMIYVTHDQEEALMISDRIALMEAGAILQTGKPRELYDAPASEEVARFIGERNMIPGVLKAVEGNEARITLEENEDGGTIGVGLKQGFQQWRSGAKIWLAVKPDDFLLESAERTSIEGWIGTILLISFAGNAQEIEIQLEQTGQILRARCDGARTLQFQRGERVRVGIGKGRGLIFERRAESFTTETQ